MCHCLCPVSVTRTMKGYKGYITITRIMKGYTSIAIIRILETESSFLQAIWRITSRRGSCPNDSRTQYNEAAEHGTVNVELTWKDCRMGTIEVKFCCCCCQIFMDRICCQMSVQ